MSPEQIQAAMPAMREWLVDHGDMGAYWLRATASWVQMRVDRHYPGGVVQFIKDQEERHGA